MAGFRGWISNVREENKRKQEIEKSRRYRESLKKKHGAMGNLPADYKETEEKAFKEAEQWQKSQVIKKAREKRLDGKLPDDLRYPYSPIEKDGDYIKFSVFEYKRSGNVTKRQINEEDEMKFGGSAFTGKALKSKYLGNIILPMPKDIKDSNQANYGQDGTMNFMQEAGLNAAGSITKEGDVGGAISTMKGAFKTAIGTEGMSNLENGGDLLGNRLAMEAVNVLGGNLTFAQVMSRSEGAVMNPNQELLFSGPTLRNFSFAFQFVPRHEVEAKTVRSIIKAFKRNMAPKGGGGPFLKTPNIFEITYEGKAKKYLNRIKLCALTNVATDYSAGLESWSTYNDGAPISMSIALSFTELLPVFYEDYEQYNDNRDGVGF